MKTTDEVKDKIDRLLAVDYKMSHQAMSVALGFKNWQAVYNFMRNRDGESIDLRAMRNKYKDRRFDDLVDVIHERLAYDPSTKQVEVAALYGVCVKHLSQKLRDIHDTEWNEIADQYRGSRIGRPKIKRRGLGLCPWMTGQIRPYTHTTIQYREGAAA